MKPSKSRKRKTTHKPKPRMGRPPGKTYPARIGPFSVGEAHAKLLGKWASEDGISESALLRELINREELRRLGHTSVMVNNAKVATLVQSKQLV